MRQNEEIINHSGSAMLMMRHRFQVGFTTVNMWHSGMLHLIRLSLLPHDKIPDMLSQVKPQSVKIAVRVATGQILKPPSVGSGSFQLPGGQY